MIQLCGKIWLIFLQKISKLDPVFCNKVRTENIKDVLEEKIRLLIGFVARLLNICKFKPIKFIQKPHLDKKTRLLLPLAFLLSS